MSILSTYPGVVPPLRSCNKHLPTTKELSQSAGPPSLSILDSQMTTFLLGVLLFSKDPLMNQYNTRNSERREHKKRHSFN